jgi:serine/threonine protein kinase
VLTLFGFLWVALSFLYVLSLSDSDLVAWNHRSMHSHCSSQEMLRRSHLTLLSDRAVSLLSVHAISACVVAAVTAFELALGEPPLAELNALSAAIKIPSCAPPTLPNIVEWSSSFRSFLSACLVKDHRDRPSASELLKHPFILAAPGPEVLLESLRPSIEKMEARHERVTSDFFESPNKHALREGCISGRKNRTRDRKSPVGKVSSLAPTLLLPFHAS